MKPSIPKGTRDFGPDKMLKRNRIFSTIRTVFEKFGYQPLETPTMENLDVLTGKYGDEGDQLIFKILNSGDYLAKIKENPLEIGFKKLIPQISEKALRYDLTVPFARYVVMNRNELTFPFKRYQIQPVWRADRPQRGRYREFYQCDADVVGTNSLLCESEIVLMIDEVLNNLGINDFTIKINNRKVLTGITEAIGAKGLESVICVAIDKLDKIGEEGVVKELLEKGITETAVNALMPIISLSGDFKEKLLAMKNILATSEEGLKGLEELEEVLSYLDGFGYQYNKLEFDIALARGLSYYTGCIFEVKVNNAQMGSISGGGRYDNLTGVFGLNGVSGVGFSFGVDRIYDVMEELNLFPTDSLASTQVLLVAFDKPTEKYALSVLATLRNNNIKAELYPEQTKMKKQLGYADDKNIPYVVLIGSDEMETGLLTFKNMQSGEQQKLAIEQIVEVVLN